DGRLAPDRVPPGRVPPEHRHAREFFPPVAYDFFPFAGIQRKVELVATPPAGIDGIRVRTELAGGAALVHVEVEHGEGELALAFDGERFEPPLRVERPRLWRPDDPHLSSLTVELGRAGGTVDRYELSVGLRTFAVDGDRLLLSGEPIELRGLGRHEDFPVLGRGASTAVAARDLLLMKDLGANSFRTSHYPCDEETLDLADRLGLLVIAETPSVGLFFAAEGLERRRMLSRRFVEELVARDANRACVVAWSVANEPHVHDSAGAAEIAGLCALARSLDPTRPVTYASHVPGDPGLAAVDFLCLNRYPGWYQLPGEIEAGVAALAAELDAVHARHAKPLVLTEFGADAIPGSHADPAAMWSEEYQAETVSRVLDLAAERPFVAGAHVWAFADFATAQAEHRPQATNFKGVFTRDRRPKLAAHELKRRWR
ncbi:MAG: glycoside hydrolase family 2 TIM barrel-domain containing protein, partial [Gaiellaceae bacterium]